MPLSGLNICAVADRVVIRERGSQWQAESGQYLLEFEGDPADGSLSVIEKKTVSEVPGGAAEWFDRGVALEPENREAALRAYQQAIAADPAFVNAHINLGRLLHEARRYAKAEQVYREAMKTCGKNPVLLYNLGVLSTTWIAGHRRWKRTRRRSPPIQAWPNATTTRRRCAKTREAEGRDPAHGAVSRMIGPRSE
jgi:tetratricopeptide (TPR) repeat protein